MGTDHEKLGRLERAVRRQGVVMGALGGVLLLVMAGGQAASGSRGSNHDGGGAAAVEYVGGGDKVYRISPDGTIEYLIVDLAHGSVEGIPDWARLHVDRTLTRDRMGNTARRGR